MTRAKRGKPRNPSDRFRQLQTVSMDVCAIWEHDRIHLRVLLIPSKVSRVSPVSRGVRETGKALEPFYIFRTTDLHQRMLRRRASDQPRTDPYVDFLIDLNAGSSYCAPGEAAESAATQASNQHR